MPELVAVDFDPFKASGTPEDFRARYSAAADKAGKALGVDPNILLGQWGLETGWGKSVIPGTNNLGNIKDLSGSGAAATDNMTGSRDKYRAYDSPEAFADDFTSLVQRKYPGAVGAKSADAFAKALKTGGYAEDPGYVDKVVKSANRVTPLNPVMAAGKAITDAIVPSANAAEAQLVPVDFDPFAKKDEPKTNVLGAPENANRGTFFRGVAQGAKDLAAGAVRGAGSIGATLLAPVDYAEDFIRGDRGPNLSSLITGQAPKSRNQERREAMDAALTEMGANPNSFSYGAGKLAGEVAGTLGVGPALGAGAAAVGAGSRVANALASGGLNLGGAPAANLAQTTANALTRAGAGVVTGGVSAGLVNPEEAGMGAVIGGAIPGVAQVGGAAGRYVGNKLAERAAENTAKFNRSAPLNQTLENGINAGYVITPSTVQPSLYNNVKESIGGKIASAQTASVRNQEVTDGLARKALGLADDAPLSVEALSKYRKDMHASGYEPLRQVGPIPAGAKFDQDLSDIVSKYTGKGTIPAVQKTEISDLIAAHRSKGFDAGDAVDAIRILRENADDAFRKGESALGKANRALADAYEGAIEDALPKGSALLENYQAARKNIAKSFTVEDGLKEGTGSVDARKLANALQKGTPMDDDLLTIARFSSAFPKATQPPSMVAGAGVHNLKAGASGLGAGVGAIAGGPVGAAVMATAPWVVPPAVRAQMFSRGAQNRLIQQAPRNLLANGVQNLDPEIARLLGRSSPVTLNALVPRVEVRGTSAD